MSVLSTRRAVRKTGAISTISARCQEAGVSMHSATRDVKLSQYMFNSHNLRSQKLAQEVKYDRRDCARTASLISTSFFSSSRCFLQLDVIAVLLALADAQRWRRVVGGGQGVG